LIEAWAFGRFVRLRPQQMIVKLQATGRENSTKTSGIRAVSLTTVASGPTPQGNAAAASLGQDMDA
jgi:hypothetical protein